MKYYISILFLSYFIISCNSQKETKEGEFLKEIRLAYKPIVENHQLLVSEITKAYASYYLDKKAINSKIVNHIIKIKDQQKVLNKTALLLLDSLKEDKQGLKKSVLNFINKKIYGTPSICWGLLISNLTYFSNNEKVVFVGSYYDENNNEIARLDTINKENLVASKITNNGFIFYESANGLDIEKYIDFLNDATNDIYEADSWYCQQNSSLLSEELIQNQRPKKLEDLELLKLIDTLKQNVNVISKYAKALDDTKNAAKFNNLKLKHSNKFSKEVSGMFVDILENDSEKEALEYIKEKIEESHNSMITGLLGRFYFENDNLDSSIFYFKKAIEYDNQNYIIYNNFAIVYCQNNNHKKAIEYYGKSLNINPFYAPSYNNRGLCYYHIEEYEKSIIDFNSSLKIDSTNKAFEFNKSLSLSALGLN